MSLKRNKAIIQDKGPWAQGRRCGAMKHGMHAVLPPLQASVLVVLGNQEALFGLSPGI